MKLPILVSVVLLGAGAALADDLAPPAAPVPPPSPAAAAPSGARVETLPACRIWVDRPVAVPTAHAERTVPVYETVKVPVVETRRVPQFAEVDEPITATREVTEMVERRVPERAPVAVRESELRLRSQKLRLPNPFDCDCPIELPLPPTPECVECERVEMRPVGVRVEQVPVTRTETYVAGTRKVRVQVGERLEQVTVGEREEQRLVGWRSEPAEALPARVETARECVVLPEERVTVVRSADAGAAPVPGTARVLTEEEFRAELERRRASP